MKLSFLEKIEESIEFKMEINLNGNWKVGSELLEEWNVCSFSNSESE